MTTPWLRTVTSRAAVLLIALFALSTAGCSLSIKYLAFDVRDGGRKIHVEKFYNDGFGGTEHEQAFHVASRGDFDKAVRILEVAARRDPNNEWTFYNLAILNEARGDWAAAEAAIKVAIREEAQDHPRPNRKARSAGGADAARFKEELAFIVRYGRR